LSINSNKHIGFSKSFIKLLSTQFKNQELKKSIFSAKYLTERVYKEEDQTSENARSNVEKSLYENQLERSNYQKRNRPSLFRKSKTVQKISTNTDLPIIKENESLIISEKINLFDSNMKRKLTNQNLNTK